MNLFSSNQSELFWWLEINTTVPCCTYYFGPFNSKKEAQLSRTGHVEDLCQEEARGIVTIVKQCQPDLLRVFQDRSRSRKKHI